MKVAKTLCLVLVGILLGVVGTLLAKKGIEHLEVTLSVHGQKAAPAEENPPIAAEVTLVPQPFNQQQLADIVELREQLGHPASAQMDQLSETSSQPPESFADHLSEVAANEIPAATSQSVEVPAPVAVDVAAPRATEEKAPELPPLATTPDEAKLPPPITSTRPAELVTAIPAPAPSVHDSRAQALRQAARIADDMARDEEASGKMRQADNLHSLASRLRREARQVEGGQK